MKFPETISHYATIKTFNEHIKKIKNKSRSFVKKIFKPNVADNTWLRDLKKNKVHSEQFVPFPSEESSGE